MIFFRKIWRALCSCNIRFEIRPFALLLKTLSFKNVSFNVLQNLGSFKTSQNLKAFCLSNIK